MSNETLFYICGIVLAVSAVTVSLAGLKLRDFPGKAMPVIVLWFVVFVGAATTFAVLHAQDEEKAKAAELQQAGEEVEKAETSGPYENEGGESKQGEGAAGGSGAQIFASAGCGSCHTLAAAGSTGKTGPNLDEFLAPDDTTPDVEEMIVDPEAEIAEGYSANVMPTNYGQQLSEAEVEQLAQYLVASTPAKPAPEAKGGGGAAKEAGTTLHVEASATALAFNTKKLTAKAGKVTIDFKNPAPIPHNVVILKDGKELAGFEPIAEGEESETAELEAGTYTFICSVPGHAQAGMEGTLTVK
jgi:plastocyanin